MKLSTFDFNESPVRALIDEAGNPWFVAADVCRSLDIANPRDAVSKGLDEDDVDTSDIIDSMGRRQQVNVVSEAGLYQLVFTSRKPEAKAFKRWVTKEVLPAIRKTGAYAVSELEPSEEDEVAHVSKHLFAALSYKRSGLMTNGDCSVVVSLASQYLRSWDVRLRLRSGKTQRSMAGGVE